MADTLTIPRCVVNILKKSVDEKGSFLRKLLVGRYINNDIKVTACVLCASIGTEDVMECAENFRAYIPIGNEIVGICILPSEKDNKQRMLKNCMDAMRVSCIDASTVMVLSQTTDGVEISEVWTRVEIDDPFKIDFTITDELTLSDTVIARTRFDIPLSFTLDERDWTYPLHTEIEKIAQDIQSGSMVYHLDHSKVLLGSNECYNIEDDTVCDKLFRYIEEEEGGRPVKKCSKKSVRCLNFTGYMDMSGSRPLESIPTCAPIIDYKTGPVEKVSLSLGIDVVTLLNPNIPVKEIADKISKSVVYQVSVAESYMSQFRSIAEFINPVPHHYHPMNLPTLVTVLHPHTILEEQLESHRREVHELLCLPQDRPLFRRKNQFIFPGAESSGGYLVNVHEGITGGSKVIGGTPSLVSGFYTYHHYMQDRFDDNKWGCAYRSLQTLVSWFKLQGYTDREVPTHREIQQTLVDIGDKEKKFVGSKQWIGSMEVSFVLDTLLGVTSKILSVSTGAEMASKGRELSSHFATQGTPVMIGGGVLAHTILGVDYNEVTGDIAFLILDPHYTGSEDKKAILDMGWCGWKGPDFWDKHAHYNMCLPQRPNVI